METWAARLLYEKGCNFTAVGDVSGGLLNPAGLDIPSITAFLRENPGALIKDYNAPGVKHISNGELLVCDTDVLIPAALENQITEDNAKNIQAEIIVEAANGPTTVKADAILQQKQVLLVPDILANAGGVVVSYFEWVQNTQYLMWDEAEVNRSLEKIMARAFNECGACAKRPAFHREWRLICLPSNDW